MEIESHITILRQEAKLFAEAAEQGGLDVDIEPCPGWDMRELVRHLSEIHLWAAAHVSKRATQDWVDDLSVLSGYWPDLAVFWPEDDALVDYYLQTNANLVSELEAAPEDLDTMTFLPAPSPLAMWARRQAHETAVHRYDAQNAAGLETRFDAEFASDGIDEILAAFAPRKNSLPLDVSSTMAVHTTDTDDRWHVTMDPNGISTVRGDGPADLTVAGDASDVYLAMWNRGDDSALQLAGDRDVLTTWHTGHRVRWS